MTCDRMAENTGVDKLGTQCGSSTLSCTPTCLHKNCWEAHKSSPVFLNHAVIFHFQWLADMIDASDGIHIVTSECTALLGWKLGVGGDSDSGFSLCTTPTYYCGSKYFYSQCPQVWNLIRTEHSLNRLSIVKNKAS